MVVPVVTSKQAEADARKRKAEARRVKRAARKAAAAAVEVEYYDSDTEDLLRLGPGAGGPSQVWGRQPTEPSWPPVPQGVSLR